MSKQFVMSQDDAVALWNSASGDYFEAQLVDYAAKAINFYTDTLPGSAILSDADARIQDYAEQHMLTLEEAVDALTAEGFPPVAPCVTKMTPTTPSPISALLHRLNDATKPVDAADRNLIIRALSTAPTTVSLDQAAGEPIGWKLVPLELTDGMRKAANEHDQAMFQPTWASTYRAMLAVSPTAPTTGSAPVAFAKDAVTREQIESWAKLAGLTSLTELALSKLGDFAIFARQPLAAIVAAPASPAASDDLRDSVLSALDDLKLVIDGTMGAVGLETTFVSLVEALEAARATAEQRDSLIEECAQACDAERKNFFRAEDSAGDGIDGCIDAIRALKSQQDAAIEAKPAEQPDTERLDFMIEQRVWIQWTLRDGSIRQCQVYDQNEDEEYLVVSGEDRYFNTAREALDAAIASQRSGDGS